MAAFYLFISKLVFITTFGVQIRAISPSSTLGSFKTRRGGKRGGCYQYPRQHYWRFSFLLRGGGDDAYYSNRSSFLEDFSKQMEKIREDLQRETDLEIEQLKQQLLEEKRQRYKSAHEEQIKEQIAEKRPLTTDVISTTNIADAAEESRAESSSEDSSVLPSSDCNIIEKASDKMEDEFEEDTSYLSDRDPAIQVEDESIVVELSDDFVEDNSGEIIDMDCVDISIVSLKKHKNLPNQQQTTESRGATKSDDQKHIDLPYTKEDRILGAQKSEMESAAAASTEALHNDYLDSEDEALDSAEVVDWLQHSVDDILMESVVSTDDNFLENKESRLNRGDDTDGNISTEPVVTNNSNLYEEKEESLSSSEDAAQLQDDEDDSLESMLKIKRGVKEKMYKNTKGNISKAMQVDGHITDDIMNSPEVAVIQKNTMAPVFTARRTIRAISLVAMYTYISVRLYQVLPPNHMRLVTLILLTTYFHFEFRRFMARERNL